MTIIDLIYLKQKKGYDNIVTFLSNLGDVPRTGIEPALPCGNQILSLARLPIPPSGQAFYLRGAKVIVEIHSSKFCLHFI